MPTNTVLFANPMWREPTQPGETPDFPGGLITQLCHHWLISAYLQAIANGFDAVRFPDDQPDMEQFEEAIGQYDPILFYGDGHGNETTFTGYLMKQVLVADLNTHIMKDRITHLLSCLTANSLGPDIIAKGGLVYEGYKVEYTLLEIDFGNLMSEPFPIDGTEYRFNWSFMEPEVLLTTALLNGSSISEALNKAMERYAAWIDFWSSVDPSEEPAASDVITYLNWDYANLVVLGDSSVRLAPPNPNGKHVAVVYAIGEKGALVERGSSCTVRIGVGCLADNCSFLGKVIEIYDPQGNKVGEGVVDHSNGGVNWGEVTFPAPAEDGDYVYTIKAYLDDLHGNITGNLRFVVGYGAPPPPGTQRVVIDCNVAQANILVDGQPWTIYGGLGSEIELENGYHTIEVLPLTDRNYVGAIIDAEGGVSPPWLEGNPFEIYVPISSEIPNVNRHIYLLFEQPTPRTQVIIDAWHLLYGGRLVHGHGGLFINGHWYGSPSEEKPDSPPISFDVGQEMTFILDTILNASTNDPYCPPPAYGKTIPLSWYWRTLHRETGNFLGEKFKVDFDFTSREINYVDVLWLSFTGGVANEKATCPYFYFVFTPRFAGSPEYDYAWNKPPYRGYFRSNMIVMFGMNEFNETGWVVPEGDYLLDIEYNPNYARFLYWADLPPDDPQRTALPRKYSEFKHYLTDNGSCPTQEHFEEILAKVPSDSSISLWGHLYPVFESYVCCVGIDYDRNAERFIIYDVNPKDEEGEPDRPTYMRQRLIYKKNTSITISSDEGEYVRGVRLLRYKFNLDTEQWQVTEEYIETNLPFTLDVENYDAIWVFLDTSEAAPPPEEYRILTIEVIPENGGTTSPYAAGEHSIRLNETVDLAWIASEGYDFDHWELDGEDRGYAATLTFVMDADHVVKAYFKPAPPPEQTLKVIMEIKEGIGEIFPAPGEYEYDVSKGGTVTIKAIPSEGWRFKYWDIFVVDTGDHITVSEPETYFPIVAPGTIYIGAYFEREVEGFPWWLLLLGVAALALTERKG